MIVTDQDHAGAKEQAIHDLFAITPTRYYQRLNTMIDTVDALQLDPRLVKRLRRLRDARQRARRRPGGGGLRADGAALTLAWLSFSDRRCLV